MAQSRLEKIGTIYSRVTGLLRTGAMKPEDQPIWYDVYTAFPPKLEPLYARPTPTRIEIKEIFFLDDISRAKFHKIVKHHETVNLLDTKTKTRAQQFVEIYEKFKNEGALDEEQIIESTLSYLEVQRKQTNERPSYNAGYIEEKSNIKTTSAKETSETNINIKNLFDKD